MPEEECQKFWLKLMEQVQAYLSQLDPPRYLIFMQARPRKTEDTKQQSQGDQRKSRPNH